MGGCGGTQKTKASSREQGDEHPLTGAGARAVSGSAPDRWRAGGSAGPGSPLLATDPRVKAATLIRGGILPPRHVPKVPISWN